MACKLCLDMNTLVCLVIDSPFPFLRLSCLWQDMNTLVCLVIDSPFHFLGCHVCGSAVLSLCSQVRSGCGGQGSHSPSERTQVSLCFTASDIFNSLLCRYLSIMHFHDMCITIFTLFFLQGGPIYCAEQYCNHDCCKESKYSKRRILWWLTWCHCIRTFQESVYMFF